MKQYILPVLFLIAATLIPYINSLKNDFVFDDHRIIADNSQIKQFEKFSMLFKKDYFRLSGENSYRPGVTFSYMLDFAVFGQNPMGFHLTNLLIHTLNGILVYLFVMLLTGAIRTNSRHYVISQPRTVKLPLLVALLFVMQPVLTEAVDAISYREDLLTFFLYMTALILYLKMRSNHFSNKALMTYLFSCIAFFCALLSKEMAITFPLIIYSYEIIILKKKKSALILFNPCNIGYIAIAVVYILIRFIYFKDPVENNAVPWPLLERFYTIPWLILSYIKVILFPVSLSADYAVKPVTSLLSISFIGPITVISMLLTVVFLIRKNRRLPAFGICFFLITMLPVYNIIYLNNPFAERYVYLPVLGVIISIGSVIISLLKLNMNNKVRSLYLILLLLVAILSAFTTFKRNKVWRNEYSLWSDTVKKMPMSRRAHLNLSLELLRRGQYDEAIGEYKAMLYLNPNDRFAINAIKMIEAYKLK